ncbi:hypothetical protein EYC59_02035 [Candidatus Saccharibacteria bacterium]|nr:MAG: hypothetical protein EYC59_02035 [Candidatus Saccharibacteria bacterium]
MFRKIEVKIRAVIVFSLLVIASIPASVGASPFGQGVFGADVPFGSGTSLTVALGGNPALNLSLNGGNFEGTGSHTLTVTTTDVVGYRLYIYATDPNLTNGVETIATSSNSTPDTLATNTWGYNTTGSTTNFVGVTNTPVVLKDANGPYKNGDDTTVTYGVKVAQTKGAGDYASSVVYTAVCKSQ